MNELKEHIQQINALCSACKVRSLFAFGSVVTNNLTIESDIDLLVDIDNSDPVKYADNYFDLKFQLQEILNRKIDLLELRALKNPFLKQQIESSKVLIYAK